MDIVAEKVFFTEFLTLWMERNPDKVQLVAKTVFGLAGKLKKELSKGVNTSELMASIYKQLDQAYAKMDKTSITCKKGCSGCCHINVSMSEPEARVIKKYMAKNNITVDKERLQIQRGKSDIQRVNLPWKDSACVFLSEEGTCKVYAVRPLNCRKYFVVSDPKSCSEYEGKVLNQVNVDMEIITSAFVSATVNGYKLMPEHFL